MFRKKGECIRGLLKKKTEQGMNWENQKVCKVQAEISGHDINQKSQYQVFSSDTLTCAYVEPA